ncbi:hypothetical protein BC936DRAFT_146106 [Jimgerdemannia flammicorona]|uniref:Uncharacterized protein n=1 Tax=Jimgerdemannia flammicorona TaxID=994334 RepID=A0A433D8D2_9FUNG|nr:hypothetical protein BC936DRAFT_146106 [Jimgerdemannia flammicorona]
MTHSPACIGTLASKEIVRLNFLLHNWQDNSQSSLAICVLKVLPRQNTLEELLKEELSGLQSSNMEDLSNSQIVVDLEGVNATTEEIQCIFHVFDQCGEGESRASRNRRDRFDWLFSCNSILPHDVRGVSPRIPGRVKSMIWKRLRLLCQSGKNGSRSVDSSHQDHQEQVQLPSTFVDGIKALFAVAVNVVGYQVQVHTVYFLGSNVFATSEIGCARLPKSLDRIHDALDMFHLVLRVKVKLPTNTPGTAYGGDEREICNTRARSAGRMDRNRIEYAPKIEHKIKEDGESCDRQDV